MPAFSYIAINELGVKKKGILSADSEKEARKMVKDLHLTPLKVSESKNTGKKLKVKNYGCSKKQNFFIKKRYEAFT